MSRDNRELSIKDAKAERMGDDSRGHMEYKAPLTQSKEYKAGVNGT